MEGLYQADLAYIQAKGFGDFAGGAAPEIVRRLRASPVPVRRVVEVGCGAGPLTAALLEAGLEVTGIDVSPELLKIARVACPRAEFQQGSIYEQEIPACEAIVAIGEPLTYHDGKNADERVQNFFRRAHEVLPRGGTLIFDLIEMGEPDLTARSWKSGEDWAVLVNTIEDRSWRSLVREIETFRKVGDLYRRGHETHHVRLFDSAEVCESLKGTGFSVSTADAYGDFRLPVRRRMFFCTRD